MILRRNRTQQSVARRAQLGSNLVEILVATSVTALAVTGAIALNSLLQQQRLALSHFEQALWLAEQQVSRLKAMPYAAVSEPERPVRVTLSHQPYAVRWQLHHQDSTRKEVSVQVTWGSEQLVLETTLAAAMMR